MKAKRNQHFSILFVCYGNAIRSQMAEAFARHYGSDVIDPRSAGVYPASIIASLTRKVLGDRNIDIGDAMPKSIPDAGPGPWDLVVNMSGLAIPQDMVRAPIRDWKVFDPIGSKEEVYVEVAREIERLVVGLILELRALRNEWQDGRASLS